MYVYIVYNYCFDSLELHWNIHRVFGEQNHRSHNEYYFSNTCTGCGLCSFQMSCSVLIYRLMRRPLPSEAL